MFCSINQNAKRQYALIACLTAAVLILLGSVVPEASGASVTYTYDEVGRVRTAAYDNGVCIAYAYDANGNRTSQAITLGGAPTTPTWGSGIFGCFYWTP